MYIDGSYIDEKDAKVSIFDRGFLMGDAVYEVSCVLDKRVCDFANHMARLHRSCLTLKIPFTLSDDEVLHIHKELIRLNNLNEGHVYMQVTRGVCERSYVFPDASLHVQPTVVLFTQTNAVLNVPMTGLNIKTVPDLRWGLRDVKTIQLLYPCMAKNEALAAGFDDAWFIQPTDNYISEGTAHNAYIVKDGIIFTRPLSHDILHGITRASVLKLVKENNLQLSETSFTVEQAQHADEAFGTSATLAVKGITNIDGVTIGNGCVGPVTKKLRQIYLEEMLNSAV